MKRPAIIIAWIVLFTIGAIYDLVVAGAVYGIQGGDYQALNPGPLAVFRPIGWVGGVLVPIGLWFMRRWAVVVYVLLQISGTAMTFVVQPAWLAEYPRWALIASLILPAIFLLTVLPYWRSMTWKTP